MRRVLLNYMKTIKFYTLGCKVNQYDTQSIREKFARDGFKELENGKPAATYVINTCTVTHRADSDSLMFIRRARQENPKAKIIVTGCLVKLDKDKIKNTDKKASIINKDKLTTHNSKPITCFKGHTRAFLKVQDGCDNFCSYCKVPLVRGSCKSRSLDEIVAEAGELAKNGFKEIVLTGICLGSYGKDFSGKHSLCDVIGALEKIEGILRIRLSSIEAGDVNDGLIGMMAKSRKLCRHLHIPIQSGDDEILKKMNRKYRSPDYLRLIRKIRKHVPEIAVTTDCIVGFPGESEANFQNTVNLVNNIMPLRVHIFPYSKREGTSAAKNYNEDVRPAIIKERILRLKGCAESCSLNYRKQFLNRSLQALVEGRLKKDNLFCEGYTDNYIRVLFKSKLNLKNRLVSVKIIKLNKEFCLGNSI